MYSMKNIFVIIATLSILSGSIVIPRNGEAGVFTLCPSSANWDNQSIKLQYILMPGMSVPDIAGNLLTNELEIDHNGVYPVGGLWQKGLVPQSFQAPSCTGIPGSGGTGYTNGACDGRLEIRVARDGKAIATGAVTVYFVEVKQSVPQAAVTFLFQNWPECGDGTKVPCAPSAPYVPFYAPIMDVVAGKRGWQNVDFMASIKATNVTPTEIRTDTTITSQPDEYLHLMVNPGPAIADSQWFAFALLDDGAAPGCMQVSKILPLKHL